MKRVDLQSTHVKLFDKYESHIIIDSRMDHKIQVEVTCSAPGCEVKGVAYVDPKAKEVKPHFCIEHNPMIERK